MSRAAKVPAGKGGARGVIVSEARMPFVAVIGGLRQLTAEKLEQAQQAGRDIGAELAKAGFGLVVYFSSAASLEPYVVSGYIGALSPGSGKIRVRYSQAQRGIVVFPEENTHADTFQHNLFPDDDWETPFYRSIAEAEGVDAALFLAGGPSTLIAGQIAIARGLPIIAVDAFGGSAAKIWTQLAQTETDRKSWGKQPVSKFVAGLADQCAAVARGRQVAVERDRKLAAYESPQRRACYAAVAFALLLAIFFFVCVAPPAGIYPFLVLIGLAAAGATGALIRAVLAPTEERAPWTSLVLGAVAGFVVGLAYLIPLLTGGSTILQPGSGVVSGAAIVQFTSAALVAFCAGIGFDKVFNRIQAQAETAPVAPPG